MNPFVYFFGAPREVAQLFDDAFEVVDGRGRIAISDGIDPQHAVPFCQPLHDVLLAEWIAVPIIAEANDVLPLDHTYDAIASCVPGGEL